MPPPEVLGLYMFEDIGGGRMFALARGLLLASAEFSLPKALSDLVMLRAHCGLSAMGGPGREARRCSGLP